MRNTRKRRQQIQQLLVEHGNVRVAELVEKFDVSPVTIRSDLSQIESQGLATRTHGGATLVRSPPREQDIHEKDALNLPLKDRIGARAAEPGEAACTARARHRHLRQDSTEPTTAQAVYSRRVDNRRELVEVGDGHCICASGGPCRTVLPA